MRLFHFAIALGVALVLTAGASAQDKAAKKAAKKGGSFQGVVQAIDKDTITVKTVATKKDPNAPVTEKKFKISDATKIEKVNLPAGQKPTKGQPLPTEAAKLSDLSKGQQVQITAKPDSDQAEKVTILPAKKKNK